jgi:hypothetical protein
MHKTRQCFWPPYPAIPAAAKYRRIPRHELTAEESAAYSAAIVTTIRRMQDAWWRSERAVVPPLCVSGTWHNGGDYRDGHADGSVGEAIRAKQRAELFHKPAVGDWRRQEQIDRIREQKYARAMGWTKEQTADAVDRQREA